jgi:type I restriction enzyme R subunit
MGYDVRKRFMPDLNPEQRAREQIDAQLLACGWVVQDYSAVDFSAGRGVALREVKLKTGRCDYFLLVDRKPVGMVEAKKEGTTLSGVAEQSARYASGLPDFLAAGLTGPLPFLYESTGVETFFRDQRDPDPRSRLVFSFHRPETLAEWAGEPNTLRARLKAMPAAHPLVTSGMRQCQIEARPGKLFRRKPPACPHPHGHRRGQDLHRLRVHLSADQVRGRATHPVSRRPLQPRQTSPR